MLQEAGWAPGPVWTGEENLASNGIRSPDRPARKSVAVLSELPGPRVRRGIFTLIFYIMGELFCLCFF
jgi:hypothetical protein